MFLVLVRSSSPPGRAVQLKSKAHARSAISFSASGLRNYTPSSAGSCFTNAGLVRTLDIACLKSKGAERGCSSGPGVERNNFPLLVELTLILIPTAVNGTTSIHPFRVSMRNIRTTGQFGNLQAGSCRIFGNLTNVNFTLRRRRKSQT